MSSLQQATGRVLVIEDETHLLDATVTFLNMEGFVADGVSSLGMAAQYTPLAGGVQRQKFHLRLKLVGLLN